MLNGQRRLLTSQTTAAAMEMIDRNPQYLDFNGLVLAHPAWHAGIVGIVASRLAEEYNKPTVLLLTPEGKPARGSARSIAGVDIGGSIAACSRSAHRPWRPSRRGRPQPGRGQHRPLPPRAEPPDRTASPRRRA